MQHTVKGKPKIVKTCTLPLTSGRTVDGVGGDQLCQRAATLIETTLGVSVAEVVRATPGSGQAVVTVKAMA